MTTSPSQFVLNVCEAFGKFVKFTVEVDSKSSTSGNPAPGADDHYKRFEEVCGENPTDKHRPSIQLKQQSLSFSPSQQHVKNVGLLVQCEECEKWRLLFLQAQVKA